MQKLVLEVEDHTMQKIEATPEKQTKQMETIICLFFEFEKCVCNRLEQWVSSRSPSERNSVKGKRKRLDEQVRRFEETFSKRVTKAGSAEYTVGNMSEGYMHPGCDIFSQTLL